MPTIAIYFASQHNRSRIIGEAMQAGAQRLGIPVDLLRSGGYRSRTHEVAIFYSLADGLRNVFEDYKRRHRAVYIDLGYWGRRKRTRWDGYHKLAVNNRHPVAYFQNRKHPADRFAQFGIPVRPWRREGRHILLAGMSEKAARAEGLNPEAWEREAVLHLRQLTDRPIVYRPKPNWPGAKLIPGTVMQDGNSIPLERALSGCHAVVTHHSNVAVEALLAGVPCICPGGVASVLSGSKMTQIESPPMPDGREQWAADLAYTQYSVEEMREGLAFRYLLDEGLI
jgi:hypothetical protein